MGVFSIELSVVHVRFLHNLGRRTVMVRQVLCAAFNQNGMGASTFMTPAIPGSLQLLW